MTAPIELIDAIRRNRAVFVKTENYVAAHLNCNEGQTLGDLWDVDRLSDYLYGEAALNNGGHYEKHDYASIFVGDAHHHSWLFHYRVRKVMMDSTWTYTWERLD